MKASDARKIMTGEKLLDRELAALVSNIEQAAKGGSSSALVYNYQSQHELNRVSFYLKKQGYKVEVLEAARAIYANWSEK